jgi:hypothetical protein
MKIIQVLGLASGVPTKFDGTYLRDFDFEGGDGRGVLFATENWTEAKLFPDFMDAMYFWRTVSTTVPERMDGKPNRPFTAFTIEIKEVGDENQVLERTRGFEGQAPLLGEDRGSEAVPHGEEESQ